MKPARYVANGDGILCEADLPADRQRVLPMEHPFLVGIRDVLGVDDPTPAELAEAMNDYEGRGR